MQDHTSPQSPNRLSLAWLVTSATLASLLAYLVACHSLGTELQQPLPETQRVMLRTILYAIAIITLPITNLIRHVLLRLNQTMPIVDANYQNAANRRYLSTIIVSMALIESIGLFGFIMFILGDDFNTLYIFTGMSTLGLFLYRPKTDEFQQIMTALAEKNHG